MIAASSPARRCCRVYTNGKTGRAETALPALRLSRILSVNLYRQGTSEVPLSYLCGEDFKAPRRFRAQSSNPASSAAPNELPDVGRQPNQQRQNDDWSMPRFLPNTRFSDCWSSVGDVTFYHRDGVCYFRKRSVCAYVGSAGQTAAGDVHKRALAAWRGLSHDVQLKWNSIAMSVRPHRPPFDGSAHITGHNLFVSAYHGFAQTGDEHIPQPAPWRRFPPFSVELRKSF